MEFTGERVVEGKTSERIWQDHLSRYLFAARFCAGKKVLDMACGTGYGARVLYEKGAAEVMAADISSEAVEYASANYGAPGIQFVRGDVCDIPFPSASFDLIVSFETIEHVSDADTALEEMRRVLRPGGVLVVSSPNRKLTSPGKTASDAPDNDHHRFEYDTGEFYAALSGFFSITGKFGQRPKSKCLFLPVLERILRTSVPGLYGSGAGGPEVLNSKWWREYRYLIAVCRKSGGRK